MFSEASVTLSTRRKRVGQTPTLESDPPDSPLETDPLQLQQSVPILLECILVFDAKYCVNVYNEHLKLPSPILASLESNHIHCNDSVTEK